MTTNQNLKLMVKEEAVSMMTTMAISLARDVVMECSKRYNFDVDEALESLDLLSVKIERKKGDGKEKKSKSKSLRIKSEFPLPFCGKKNEKCCDGLRLNQGLYTQCMIAKKKESSYCKVCDDQARKNGNGKPDYGTIDDRLKVGLMDYKDPKGKMPIAYQRLMKKLKISEEMVCKEANKYNLTIDPLHFEEAEDGKRGRPKGETRKEEGELESKKKGRPKKSKKVLEIEGESTDLFAELVASAAEKEEKEEIIVAKEVSKEVAIKEKKKVRIVEEEVTEKEAKKAAKEQEKLEKLKKKEAELKKKEEEEFQKKEAELKKKETELKKKEDEEADVVKKMEYEGKKYLKSKKTGIVYNMEQDVIGKWDEESKKIIFDEEEEEEEEEEYDE